MKKVMSDSGPCKITDQASWIPVVLMEYLKDCVDSIVLHHLVYDRHGVDSVVLHHLVHDQVNLWAPLQDHLTGDATKAEGVNSLSFSRSPSCPSL